MDVESDPGTTSRSWGRAEGRPTGERTAGDGSILGWQAILGWKEAPEGGESSSVGESPHSRLSRVRLEFHFTVEMGLGLATCLLPDRGLVLEVRLVSTEAQSTPAGG
jgi:hypothetical protein